MQKHSTLIVAIVCLFLGGCAVAIFSPSDLKDISAGETKAKMLDKFDCGHG
jgi:hypothetical protein